MKIHKAALKALFEANDRVLDAEEVFEIGRVASDRSDRPKSMRAFLALASLVAALRGGWPRAATSTSISSTSMGGAATLIVTPEGESVLIDSGWAGIEDRDPIRIEKVLKDDAKLDHLDHLVTTHWHMDHFGGVEGIARRLRVDHFWDRGLPDLDGRRTATRPTIPTARRPATRSARATGRPRRASGRPSRRATRCRLKGVEALVLASGGKVIEGPSGPANPLCESSPAGPGRSTGRTTPGAWPSGSGWARSTSSTAAT